MYLAATTHGIWPKVYLAKVTAAAVDSSPRLENIPKSTRMLLLRRFSTIHGRSSTPVIMMSAYTQSSLVNSHANCEDACDKRSAQAN